jgi:uncharacterized protein YbaR (Trm112 family)
MIIDSCDVKYCPDCRIPLRHKIVESSDGAFEDIHYYCEECNYQYWIDGIDS